MGGADEDEPYSHYTFNQTKKVAGSSDSLPGTPIQLNDGGYCC